MKFLITAFFLFTVKVYASSCCGGGSSSSMIITGDNKAEFSLGYSFRDDLGQTGTDGLSYFNNPSTIDRRHNLNLQAQFQPIEYFQFAVKSSLVEKSLNKSGLNESNFGMGDIDIQVSYEYLPEFTYNRWKPRAFIYSKVSIPTSKSLYNSSSSIMTDVRGSGLYSTSLGNFLLKRVEDTTLKLTLEWSHFFGRNFGGTKLYSYEKFLLPMGISYAFTDSPFSVGVTDTFSYQTNKTLSGAIQTKSKQEYFWELNTFVNISPTREEIYSFSYSDSTLIGKNVNSPLYRSISLTYTYLVAL